MFNYNAENNNNYNTDNNNNQARAEWVAVDKRYDEVSGGGGIHLAAAAAGARVNLSRRHISKWRRLIDISADYFMATHTHTHMYMHMHT